MRRWGRVSGWVWEVKAGWVSVSGTFTDGVVSYHKHVISIITCVTVIITKITISVTDITMVLVE